MSLHVNLIYFGKGRGGASEWAKEIKLSLHDQFLSIPNQSQLICYLDWDTCNNSYCYCIQFLPGPRRSEVCCHQSISNQGGVCIYLYRYGYTWWHHTCNIKYTSCYQVFSKYLRMCVIISNQPWQMSGREVPMVWRAWQAWRARHTRCCQHLTKFDQLHVATTGQDSVCRRPESGR